MRVQFKLAFIFLIGIAALCGVRGPAEASVAALPIGGLEASAHVSDSVQPAYHPGIAPARSAFCYSQHIQCRLDAGYGHRYRRCMRRRDCYPHFDGDHYPGDIYEFRRKGYSCRYWYDRCRDNWCYPEDVRGCLRYYSCLRHYY